MMSTVADLLSRCSVLQARSCFELGPSRCVWYGLLIALSTGAVGSGAEAQDSFDSGQAIASADNPAALERRCDSPTCCADTWCPSAAVLELAFVCTGASLGCGGQYPSSNWFECCGGLARGGIAIPLGAFDSDWHASVIVYCRGASLGRSGNCFDVLVPARSPWAGDRPLGNFLFRALLAAQAICLKLSSPAINRRRRSSIGLSSTPPSSTSPFLETCGVLAVR